MASKDLDDIYKKLDQNNKFSQKESDEITKTVNSIEKNNEKILKEINDVKKEVKNIAFKVDNMLEILNTFTIMLAETEDEEDLENYDDADETWVPKEDEFWEGDDEENL
jgi:hypothetical protein